MTSMTTSVDRPGFGERHPDLATLLALQTPVATHETSWLGGAIPLRISAYMTPSNLPDELVSSVRCVVRVGDLIVLCENADGAHPLPGGRRHAGESFVATAAREVREETGWLINRDSLRLLGWLHLEHLGPRRLHDPYPYPDFLQVVFCGTATDRDGGRDVAWTDTEGYELRSSLVTVDEARRRTSTDLLAPVFLDALPHLGPP
jgi:hypothetical protein